MLGASWVGQSHDPDSKGLQGPSPNREMGRCFINSLGPNGGKCTMHCSSGQERKLGDPQLKIAFEERGFLQCVQVPTLRT